MQAAASVIKLPDLSTASGQLWTTVALLALAALTIWLASSSGSASAAATPAWQGTGASASSNSGGGGGAGGRTSARAAAVPTMAYAAASQASTSPRVSPAERRRRSALGTLGSAGAGANAMRRMRARATQQEASRLDFKSREAEKMTGTVTGNGRERSSNAAQQGDARRVFSAREARQSGIVTSAGVVKPASDASSVVHRAGGTWTLPWLLGTLRGNKAHQARDSASQGGVMHVAFTRPASESPAGLEQADSMWFAKSPSQSNPRGSSGPGSKDAQNAGTRTFFKDRVGGNGATRSGSRAGSGGAGQQEAGARSQADARGAYKARAHPSAVKYPVNRPAQSDSVPRSQNSGMSNSALGMSKSASTETGRPVSAPAGTVPRAPAPTVVEPDPAAALSRVTRSTSRPRWDALANLHEITSPGVKAAADRAASAVPMPPAGVARSTARPGWDPLANLHKFTSPGVKSAADRAAGAVPMPASGVARSTARPGWDPLANMRNITPHSVATAGEAAAADPAARLALLQAPTRAAGGGHKWDPLNVLHTIVPNAAKSAADPLRVLLAGPPPSGRDEWDPLAHLYKISPPGPFGRDAWDPLPRALKAQPPRARPAGDPWQGLMSITRGMQYVQVRLCLLEQLCTVLAHSNRAGAAPHWRRHHDCLCDTAHGPIG
jgi:hypothetical protein